MTDPAQIPEIFLISLSRTLGAENMANFCEATNAWPQVYRMAPLRQYFINALNKITWLDSRLEKLLLGSLLKLHNFAEALEHFNYENERNTFVTIPEASFKCLKVLVCYDEFASHCNNYTLQIENFIHANSDFNKNLGELKIDCSNVVLSPKYEKGDFLLQFIRHVRNCSCMILFVGNMFDITGWLLLADAVNYIIKEMKSSQKLIIATLKPKSVSAFQYVRWILRQDLFDFLQLSDSSNWRIWCIENGSEWENMCRWACSDPNISHILN